MTLGEVDVMLKTLPSADARPVFLELARQWRHGPPDDFNDLDAWFAGEDVEAFRDVVTSWPVTGKCRDLLVFWHDQHGDSAPLIALFDDVVASSTPHNNHGTMVEALAMTTFHPQLPVIRHVQRILARNGEGRGAASLVRECLGAAWQSRLVSTQMQLQPKTDHCNALRVLLEAQLLADARPAAKLFTDWEMAGDVTAYMRRGDPLHPSEVFASDLRLCDYAGATILAALVPSGNQSIPLVDLCATVAQRDRARAILRHYVQDSTPAMLVSAGRPLKTPEFTLKQDPQKTDSF
jgi:hypothetical protein